MSGLQFYKSLFWVSGTTALVLFGMHVALPPMKQHASLSVFVLLLFVGLSTGLYYAGNNAVRSKSKVAFNGLVSLSVFAKMVLAIAVLYIYQQTTLPTNQWFVGIFLFVYIVYTIYEVWFMSKIART